MTDADRQRVGVAPEWLSLLKGDWGKPALFGPEEITSDTVWVSMRDGVRLATELYLPPVKPAPVIVMRTPYGRATNNSLFVEFARRGYAVVTQDCRGTGDSEPDSWDYYVYEREDGFDFVEWVIRQTWYGGFVGSCGGSYAATTQWCMSLHPCMSAIAPEVGGVGVDTHTARIYMFANAYSRCHGKGAAVKLPYAEMEQQMLGETLAGGYFNEPLHVPFREALLRRYPNLRSLAPGDAQRWLWSYYVVCAPAQRAELIKLALGVDRIAISDVESLPAIFGQRISHDAHGLPRERDCELMNSIRAPALMITGWYDWYLDDALATWSALTVEGRESVRSRCRLLITPGAHSKPGYHEGRESSPELDKVYRLSRAEIAGLVLRWYAAIREDDVGSWPPVIYYLMGANEWHAAPTWPPQIRTVPLHLGAGGTLAEKAPEQAESSDSYTYDPDDPTPTVGGSIVSYVYPPGSVDVSAVQRRADVLTYTTDVLLQDVDIVGPLRLVLYVSSSAVDTDFSARLSDVFPDGRAIQLQNGILRTRYRHRQGDPQWLEPGRIYRLEIDMCATANRFKAGHRLRLDVSSADFPKFDRNTNRDGEVGPPLRALQTIYHDASRPSHLLVPVLTGCLNALGPSHARG